METEFNHVLLQKQLKNLDVLPIKIADILLEKGIKVAIAESITGGDLCSSLVKVAGASDFISGGIVAYSNFIKVNECTVNPKTIKQFGAVSSQTTLEMAAGIKKRFHSDISIATTGFAGPQRQQERVGLVFIALDIEPRPISKEFFFSGSRKEIIEQTTFSALELLRYYINN